MGLVETKHCPDLCLSLALQGTLKPQQLISFLFALPLQGYVPTTGPHLEGADVLSTQSELGPSHFFPKPSSLP